MREEGNNLFNVNKYQMAMIKYSAAVAFAPTDKVIFLGVLS